MGHETSGRASSDVEQLIENVLFKLRCPVFLLSLHVKTPCGLSRMLPCQRGLSVWIKLHSYKEGGAAGFVCSAWKSWCFFKYLGIFISMQGPFPSWWCPSELVFCRGSARPLARWGFGALSARGIVCGRCVWDLRTEGSKVCVFASWNTWGEVIDHNLTADLATQRTAHHHVNRNGLSNGNGADGCFLIIPLCCKC